MGVWSCIAHLADDEHTTLVTAGREGAQGDDSARAKCDDTIRGKALECTQ